MQKIYLLRENEPLEKIAKIFNQESSSIRKSPNKILGYNYAILEDGASDIILIENYHPPRIYKVLESDTKESILSKGYEFQNEQIEENDIILLTKIEGKKHIVRPLETLENIANSYFIDKADIINRNNLKTEKLFIGQILWV